MSKLKTIPKKQKVVTSKKVSTRNNASSAKPIKLGGVPNQGSVQ